MDPGTIELAALPAFSSPWMTVREARWHRDGATEIWHYQDHPGCSLTLPVTADGEVVFIRAFRVPVSQWCWELPAGRVDPGESPEQAALRELAEEVGGICGEVTPLGSVFSSSGSSNERIHVFLARDVELSPSVPTGSECLERVLVPWPQAIQKARAGEIADGASALALFWADALRLV